MLFLKCRFALSNLRNVMLFLYPFINTEKLSKKIASNAKTSLVASIAFTFVAMQCMSSNAQAAVLNWQPLKEGFVWSEQDKIFFSGNKQVLALGEKDTIKVDSDYRKVGDSVVSIDFKGANALDFGGLQVKVDTKLSATKLIVKNFVTDVESGSQLTIETSSLISSGDRVITKTGPGSLILATKSQARTNIKLQIAEGLVTISKENAIGSGEVSFVNATKQAKLHINDDVSQTLSSFTFQNPELVTLSLGNSANILLKGDINFAFNIEGSSAEATIRSADKITINKKYDSLKARLLIGYDIKEYTNSLGEYGSSLTAYSGFGYGGKIYISSQSSLKGSGAVFGNLVAIYGEYSPDSAIGSKHGFHTFNHISFNSARYDKHPVIRLDFTDAGNDTLKIDERGSDRSIDVEQKVIVEIVGRVPYKQLGNDLITGLLQSNLDSLGKVAIPDAEGLYFVSKFELNAEQATFSIDYDKEAYYYTIVAQTTASNNSALIKLLARPRSDFSIWAGGNAWTSNPSSNEWMNIAGQLGDYNPKDISQTLVFDYHKDLDTLKTVVVVSGIKELKKGLNFKKPFRLVDDLGGGRLKFVGKSAEDIMIRVDDEGDALTHVTIATMIETADPEAWIIKTGADRLDISANYQEDGIESSDTTLQQEYKKRQTLNKRNDINFDIREGHLKLDGAFVLGNQGSVKLGPGTSLVLAAGAKQALQNFEDTAESIISLEGEGTVLSFQQSVTINSKIMGSGKINVIETMSILNTENKTENEYDQPTIDVGYDPSESLTYLPSALRVGNAVSYNGAINISSSSALISGGSAFLGEVVIFGSYNPGQYLSVVDAFSNLNFRRDSIYRSPRMFLDIKADGFDRIKGDNLKLNIQSGLVVDVVIRADVSSIVGSEYDIIDGLDVSASGPSLPVDSQGIITRFRIANKIQDDGDTPKAFALVFNKNAKKVTLKQVDYESLVFDTWNNSAVWTSKVGSGEWRHAYASAFSDHHTPDSTIIFEHHSRVFSLNFDRSKFGGSNDNQLHVNRLKSVSESADILVEGDKIIRKGMYFKDSYRLITGDKGLLTFSLPKGSAEQFIMVNDDDANNIAAVTIETPIKILGDHQIIKKGRDPLVISALPGSIRHDLNFSVTEDRLILVGYNPLGKAGTVNLAAGSILEIAANSRQELKQFLGSHSSGVHLRPNSRLSLSGDTEILSVILGFGNLYMKDGLFTLDYDDNDVDLSSELERNNEIVQSDFANLWVGYDIDGIESLNDTKLSVPSYITYKGIVHIGPYASIVGSDSSFAGQVNLYGTYNPNEDGIGAHQFGYLHFKRGPSNTVPKLQIDINDDNNDAIKSGDLIMAIDRDLKVDVKIRGRFSHEATYAIIYGINIDRSGTSLETGSQDIATRFRITDSIEGVGPKQAFALVVDKAERKIVFKQVDHESLVFDTWNNSAAWTSKDGSAEWRHANAYAFSDYHTPDSTILFERGSKNSVVSVEGTKIIRKGIKFNASYQLNEGHLGLLQFDHVPAEDIFISVDGGIDGEAIVTINLPINSNDKPITKKGRDSLVVASSNEKLRSKMDFKVIEGTLKISGHQPLGGFGKVSLGSGTVFELKEGTFQHLNSFTDTSDSRLHLGKNSYLSLDGIRTINSLISGNGNIYVDSGDLQIASSSQIGVYAPHLWVGYSKNYEDILETTASFELSPGASYAGDVSISSNSFIVGNGGAFEGAVELRGTYNPNGDGIGSYSFRSLKFAESKDKRKNPTLKIDINQDRYDRIIGKDLVLRVVFDAIVDVEINGDISNNLQYNIIDGINIVDSADAVKNNELGIAVKFRLQSNTNKRLNSGNSDSVFALGFDKDKLVLKSFNAPRGSRIFNIWSNRRLSWTGDDQSEEWKMQDMDLYADRHTEDSTIIFKKDAFGLSVSVKGQKIIKKGIIFQDAYELTDANNGSLHFADGDSSQDKFIDVDISNINEKYMCVDYHSCPSIQIPITTSGANDVIIKKGKGKLQLVALGSDDRNNLNFDIKQGGLFLQGNNPLGSQGKVSLSGDETSLVLAKGTRQTLSDLSTIFNSTIQLDPGSRLYLKPTSFRDRDIELRSSIIGFGELRLEGAKFKLKGNIGKFNGLIEVADKSSLIVDDKGFKANASIIVYGELRGLGRYADVSVVGVLEPGLTSSPGADGMTFENLRIMKGSNIVYNVAYDARHNKLIASKIVVLNELTVSDDSAISLVTKSVDESVLAGKTVEIITALNIEGILNNVNLLIDRDNYKVSMVNNNNAISLNIDSAPKKPEKDPSKDQDKDLDPSKDKDNDKNKHKDKDKDKDQDKDSDSSEDNDNDKNKDQDQDQGSEPSKDKDGGQGSDPSKDKDGGQGSDPSKDKGKDRGKDTSKDPSRNQDKDQANADKNLNKDLKITSGPTEAAENSLKIFNKQNKMLDLNRDGDSNSITAAHIASNMQANITSVVSSISHITDILQQLQRASWLQQSKNAGKFAGKPMKYTNDARHLVIEDNYKEHKNNVWIRYNHELAYAGSGANMSGYKRSAHSFLLGATSEVNKDLIIGIASGIGKGNVQDSFGTSKNQSYLAALYGSYSLLPNYDACRDYICNIRFGSIVSMIKSDSVRVMNVYKPSQELLAQYWLGSVQFFTEFGRAYRYQFATIEPFAQFIYQHNWRDELTETGGTAALTAPLSRFSNLISGFGFNLFTMPQEISFGKFSSSMQFSNSLGIRYRFGQLGFNEPIRFVNNSNESDVVDTTMLMLSRYEIFAKFGLTFEIKKLMDMSFGYGVSVGDFDIRHALNLAFSKRF